MYCSGTERRGSRLESEPVLGARFVCWVRAANAVECKRCTVLILFQQLSRVMISTNSGSRRLSCRNVIVCGHVHRRPALVPADRRRDTGGRARDGVPTRQRVLVARSRPREIATSAAVLRLCPRSERTICLLVLFCKKASRSPIWSFVCNCSTSVTPCAIRTSKRYRPGRAWPREKFTATC